jgi:hypothetical protein
MRPSVPDVHITDAQDADLATYRALTPQAVGGLIFGLLAPLAMIDPLLWAMPALGVVFSAWGLRRIRSRNGELVGRKLAWIGLVLSLLFMAAAPAEALTYQAMIRKEARQFAAQWFRYLGQEEPQKAYQLYMSPRYRQPLNDRLWQLYRSSPEQGENLKQFVKLPVVQTLLALGPKAQVRFYQTASKSRDEENDQVNLDYAVTYEEQGEQKSFFVRVRLLREEFGKRQAGWRVLNAEGGVRPDGW